MMTYIQIIAIIGLLHAFGVSPSTIQLVQNDLTNQQQTLQVTPIIPDTGTTQVTIPVVESPTPEVVATEPNPQNLITCSLAGYIPGQYGATIAWTSTNATAMTLSSNFHNGEVNDSNYQNFTNPNFAAHTTSDDIASGTWDGLGLNSVSYGGQTTFWMEFSNPTDSAMCEYTFQ